ncbi:universal stress protein [Carboxydochorda subterranea]|uniref:Universal stress protein n=1 Tax=Carboxydichorda subterranea TaxID=3109565 RepID=A0ABZ1BWR8_9FIRM|nr:universal stress protein [Limnochorda sp. L945t]WRP17239.1 universal stress protein [Limnochorda sp. L945t]
MPLFNRLLVPLDGSRLAEAVLPVVETMARSLAASVTLLHVIEARAPVQVHGDRHLCDPAEAGAYLDGVMQRLAGKGLSVECHVHEAAEGDVARSIVQHAEELANDLVMLSTHGHGGMRGFLVGSIAQQVLVHGTHPVLVVHPDATPEPWRCERIAVPLDGGPHHEHSLPVACELATALGATLHLVTVVPRRSDLPMERAAAGRLLPRTVDARLDIEEQAAVHYLERLGARLCEQAAPPKAQVRRGEPAAELVGAFRDARIDLVVMASHALKGWDAFWAGSVTPKILSQWRGPVLLVRARAQPPR